LIREQRERQCCCEYQSQQARVRGLRPSPQVLLAEVALALVLLLLPLFLVVLLLAVLLAVLEGWRLLRQAMMITSRHPFTLQSMRRLRSSTLRRASSITTQSNEPTVWRCGRNSRKCCSACLRPLSQPWTIEQKRCHVGPPDCRGGQPRTLHRGLFPGRP